MTWCHLDFYNLRKIFIIILNWSYNLNQDYQNHFKRWMWLTLSQVSRGEKAESQVVPFVSLGGEIGVC